MTSDYEQDKRRSLFYMLHELNRLARRRFDAIAQPHGMTLPQWRALWQLYRQDGLSQSTLAGLIDSDPMTLSGMMERLEGKGLVVRQPDPADSRAKVVRITDSARELVEHMKTEMDRAQADALVDIPEEERAAMMKTLERLRDNLAAATNEDEKI